MNNNNKSICYTEHNNDKRPCSICKDKTNNIVVYFEEPVQANIHEILLKHGVRGPIMTLFKIILCKKCLDELKTQYRLETRPYRGAIKRVVNDNDDMVSRFKCYFCSHKLSKKEYYIIYFYNTNSTHLSMSLYVNWLLNGQHINFGDDMHQIYDNCIEALACKSCQSHLELPHCPEVDYKKRKQEKVKND